MCSIPGCPYWHPFEAERLAALAAFDPSLTMKTVNQVKFEEAVKRFFATRCSTETLQKKVCYQFMQGNCWTHAEYHTITPTFMNDEGFKARLRAENPGIVMGQKWEVPGWYDSVRKVVREYYGEFIQNHPEWQFTNRRTPGVQDAGPPRQKVPCNKEFACAFNALSFLVKDAEPCRFLHDSPDSQNFFEFLVAYANKFAYPRQFSNVDGFLAFVKTVHEEYKAAPTDPGKVRMPNRDFCSTVMKAARDYAQWKGDMRTFEREFRTLRLSDAPALTQSP
jgi:hypothetical protein